MSALVLRRAPAGLLVLPLLLFVALFFVWPLWVMMGQAVSDPAVSRSLPQLSDAIDAWDGQAEPTPAMREALVADLAAATDRQATGEMTRRLNSAQAGFRTLMGGTLRAVQGAEEPAALDLYEIDPRWREPSWWTTIDTALSPVTDRNLLAAVDFGRDASGAIVSLPAGESANLAIFQRTFVISASVTLGCLLIGLPYAMIAASVTGWRRNVMLAAILLPLWTSLLVRTAAWFIILQDNGLINNVLLWLGLTSSPLPLIFNRTGVVVAMIHVLLPFMVLPIYSVLISIPKNLMPAAASLGAHPLRAFWRVLLPLSMRGVASGALLVFMSSIGYYITPALIGGPTDQMISSIIAFYASNQGNWAMAGALGIVLLVLTLALYAVYARLSAEDRRLAR